MSERAKQVEQVAVLSAIALLVIGSIIIVLPFLRVTAIISRKREGSCPDS